MHAYTHAALHYQSVAALKAQLAAADDDGDGESVNETGVGWQLVSIREEMRTLRLQCDCILSRVEARRSQFGDDTDRRFVPTSRCTCAVEAAANDDDDRRSGDRGRVTVNMLARVRAAYVQTSAPVQCWGSEIQREKERSQKKKRTLTRWTSRLRLYQMMPR